MMFPDLFVAFLLGVFVTIVFLVGGGWALVLYLGRSSVRAVMPVAGGSGLADSAEPTDVAVLRHDHRFGPKDGDGIRHCRCADRYLDGMVV